WAANGLDPGQPTGFSSSGTAIFPRDPLGLSSGQADVDCENSAALEEGGPLGTAFGDLLCAYDFGSFFLLQAEESLRKMHTTGHYDLTDTFSAYFEFAANDSEFDRLNSLNPNAPILTIGTSHFGNIEDAFRRGIEPIEVGNQTRLLGGTRNTSKVDRPLDTFTNTTRSDQRYVLGALWDFEIGDRSWTIDASYTASEHDQAETNTQDTLSAQMELSINGLGGPNCDIVNGTPGDGNLRYAASGGVFNDPAGGNCFYFNPFGNDAFARDGSRQTDLTLINPPELMNYLAGRVTSDAEYRQRVYDVVATGDIWDLPNGPVGMAVGFQRRNDKGTVVYDGATNSNNLDFAFGAQDWSGRLTTVAFFVELGIPILENLEVNVAVRYEDFDEINEDTTDPKITILWRPTESLSLRASAGSSFRVPSVQQLFGNLTTVHNLADTGLGGTAFRPAVSLGNPNLAPESADSYNLGLSWEPQEGFLEGFRIDIDYYDYDYEDIITRESHAILLAEDLALLGVFADDNGVTLAQAVAAGAGNREQVIRNSTGGLLRILPLFANANGADVSGVDVDASYSFDTGWGSWRVGVQAAWLNEYEVDVPNRTGGGSTVFDAVGEYNDANPVARPLPEWKVNGTLSWSMDNQRAFLIVKYVDGVNHNLTGGAGFFAATSALAHGPAFAADFLDSSVDSWTIADVQYTYSFGETGFMSDTSVSLGIQNFTNEEPPFVPVITGYDGTLHDPRGRIFFFKASASM
ncbi:MAG: TonB-dependent receptor, partial [Gammaproteobacteria bacterium]|nr:TonB-dependent receptor [Gammaproteobacteria bacterium]